MKSLIPLVSFYLSLPTFSFAEKIINEVEDNLHKVIKKYDMDVTKKKTYEKTKQEEILIRQKELELKGAVEKHNKDVKKNAENEELKKREGKKSGFRSSLASFEQMEKQAKDIKDLQENLNKLVELFTTLKKDIETLKRDKEDGGVSEKAKRKKVSSKMQTEFDEALKILDRAPDEAVDYFEKFATKYKNHTLAISAHLKIADAYMKMAKWDLANKTLQNISKNKDISTHQQVEMLLLLADSQRNQNDRTNACKTLADLERSNLPLTSEQNETYQQLIVASDCASKLDKDIREKEDGEEKKGEAKE